MIVPMVEGRLENQSMGKMFEGAFVVPTKDFYVKKGMNMTYKVSHIIYILSRSI